MIIAGALSTPAIAQQNILQSAGSLTFGPDNVLFVGDSKAGAVHAFEFTSAMFDDQSEYPLGRAATAEGRTMVRDLSGEIGSMLGVEASEIMINDIVVHKPSGQVFLSVHRGLGPDAEAIIMKVDKGELHLVELGDAGHSSIEVGTAEAGVSLEFGQLVTSLSITDIDYYKGEIFVAGVENGEFASKLRRIPFPFTDEVRTSSIEIWHAVHAQFETRAPIIAQSIQEIDGEPTLIAVYACTPIVRIPLAELTDGAHVRGDMIGEIGYGNTPVDIIGFNSFMDQKDYVLITNTSRSAVQVALNDIAASEPMPSGEGVHAVFGPAGVSQFPLPISGALHMDTINEQWSVMVRNSPENVGQIDLHTVLVPFFLERADHIVEMAWPDAADPYGYRTAEPKEY